jgi:hypothetical protein
MTWFDSQLHDTDPQGPRGEKHAAFYFFIDFSEITIWYYSSERQYVWVQKSSSLVYNKGKHNGQWESILFSAP